MAYIIIAGNSMDGYNYYGPFATVEEARKWATNNGNVCGEEWSITDLKSANDDHAE